MYFTFRNFFFFFTMSKAISVSTEPIFTVFAPYCRYWIANERPPFFDILRDVAMATNLVAKMGQNYLPPALIALSFRNGMAYRLANTRIHSYTNCSTSCEKMVKIGSVVFELKWGRKWKLSCKSAKIGRFSFIWHTGVLKRIGISQFWFQQVNCQSFLYTSWKFGDIRISHPGVLGKKMYGQSR